MFLAEQGSEVTVVIRGPDLNAGMSRYLVDRLDGHPRIEVLTQTQVVGLEGEQSLRAVRLAGIGRERSVEVAGLFSFIGAEPASELALRMCRPRRPGLRPNRPIAPREPARRPVERSGPTPLCLRDQLPRVVRGR